MHENSLTAWDGVRETKEARKSAIVALFRARGNAPMRDVDVLSALFPGGRDPNLVRPRITELHRERVLVEGPPGRSPHGSRPVRTSRLAAWSVQTSLFD